MFEFKLEFICCYYNPFRPIQNNNEKISKYNLYLLTNTYKSDNIYLQYYT